MDSQDQVLQKLGSIEQSLRSLRYTFGIVLIILAVLLAIAAPAVVRLITAAQNGPDEWSHPGTKGLMKEQAPAAAPAATSTKSTATTTKP